MASQRKLSYREFADGLEEVFESLAHGDEDEIVVEKAGRLYKVARVGADSAKRDIMAAYDPERALAAMRRSQGALDGLDIEQFKLELRQARGQDSAGRPGD